MTPARVLIAAENCSVRSGGEAILPYHYFRLLLERGVDAHLIVHGRSRAELEDLFPSQAAQIHLVADRGLQKLFYKLGRGLPRRLDEATLGLANQMLTQAAQRPVIRRLWVPGAVLHQPIPVSPRFPSLLSGLGLPLVVGPLNGGMEYPPSWHGAEGFASGAAIMLARLLTDAGNRLFPGKREAAVVLVANARTRAALPSGLRGRVLELAENGVDTSAFTLGDTAPETAEKRFVFIGRLVDWKAVDVVLEALCAVPGATLDIIGDGPMLAPWQALAAELGLAERVRFLGWRTQAECAQRLDGCCALLLPSVYECGGAVVLEAMAMARPVIATAWGGPLDYLDASCGMLVEPSSRAALVAGFVQAMQRLLGDAALRTRMGAAGRVRLLREFSWERKIDRILEVYALALEDR